MTIAEFPRPHRKSYFSLANLPQSMPVSSIAIDTGWWELDQIWKLYPGQFTIVTGIAGHGKSTFLLNVICNLAIKHGAKSFLYVPENERHLQEKLKGIWGDRDGFDKFCAEQCFIQSAIPDDHTSEPQDLMWVLDRAKAAIDGEGVDVLLIDPWNELEHAKPKDMLMTDYIRTCLMHLKQFSRAYGVAIILVAHPTKAVTENGGRAPALSDIEGSMNWYNKCDNGLIVVREMNSSNTKVISAKVREIGAGKIGTCWFYVDAATGQFTPQQGGVI